MNNEVCKDLTASRAKLRGSPVETLKPEMDPRDELGVDGMDMADIALMVEEKVGAVLSDAHLERSDCPCDRSNNGKCETLSLGSGCEML